MIRPTQINSSRNDGNLESKNICYVFKKSVIFGKITVLLKKNGKKVDFFSCDFEIFYGTIGCATKC